MLVRCSSNMYKESVLLVVAFLAVANAFHTLVKNDEELVYNYTAVIRLGVVHPAQFASHFELHGKLRMQADASATLVSLSDLSFTLKNGKDFGNVKHGEQPVQIEEKMKDLVKPFKVVFDSTGKVEKISTDSSENEHVRDMKKAIAAVIQLDISKIQLDLNGKQHSFNTEEQSIQGKVEVNYNVVPKGDKIVITKLLDTNTRHTDHHVMTNTERAKCGVKKDYPFTQYSKREYVIEQSKTGNKVVSEVEAQGGISLHLFKGKEGYYLYTHQKLHLLEVKPVQQRLAVKSDRQETIVSDAGLHTEGYSKALKDSISQQDLKTEVIRLLGKAVDYLNENHIHMDTPDVKKEMLIGRIKSILSMSDLPTLQQIHDSLKQKTSEHDLQVLELYHQVIPFVGTHDSLKHIKELIVQKKVKDTVATELLKVMSLHVKRPTQEVVTDMEDLINLDSSIDAKVRKTALLSFSILVGKAHKLEKSLRQHDEDVQKTHGGYEHEEVETSVYDKYVHSFVSKLRASNEFSKQKLFLEVLYNMRIKSTYAYLEPGLQGKWWDNDDFRLRALWAVSPLIRHDPHKILNWYWPILVDTTKDTEHRVEAFYAIMNSQPGIVHLTDIYWLMKKETSKELYHVFYSYVHAVMHSTNPCREDFKERVTKIFNSLPKLDKRSISGFYLTDFYDQENGFGSGIGALVLSTNTTKVLHGTLATDIFNPRWHNFGFWIKIVGLESGFADKFLLNTQSTSKIFNWQDVLQILTSIPNNNHIHIEGSIAKDGYVVDGFFYDGSNIKDLVSLFGFFNAEQFSFEKNGIVVQYSPETRIVLTTDVGIPAAIDFMVPIVHKYKFNLNKETSDKITNLNLDGLWKVWSHGTYGIQLFNPIANIKQKVMKHMQYDAVLPVKVDVSANLQQQKMKVTWKVPTQEEGNIIGIRSHVTPVVVTKHFAGEHILQRSSPEDEDAVHVTHGDDFRHNYTYNKHDINTGYNILTAVFDADPETYVTHGSTMEKLKKLILSTPETHNTCLDFVFNSIRHVYLDTFLQPSTKGMKGVLVKLTPSTETPVTHLDLSVRLNQEIQRDENLFTPKITWNSRATYSVKNKDQALRTWDVNAVSEWNSGHTNNNFKVVVTRIVPSQKDFKVCVDSTWKYEQEKLTGHVNVATSQSSEPNKCNADETMLDINVLGQKIKEQQEDHVVYGVCSYPQNQFMEPDYTLRCIAADSTLREYIYDVKTTNVPNEFKKTAMHWLDYLKGMFMSHYTHVPEHQEDVGENNLKVKIEYPVVGHQMNIEVISHQQAWKLESIHVHDVPLLDNIGKPESTHVSDLLHFMHSVGLTDVCKIHKDDVHHHHHTEQKQVTDDWELYWGDKVQNPHLGVYVKKVEGKLALKLVHKTHVLEVLPQGDRHKITLNGQDVSNVKHIEEEWMHLVVKPKTGDKTIGPVYVVVPDTGLIVKHDIHTVKIEVPKFDAHFKGHCTDKM